MTRIAISTTVFLWVAIAGQAFGQLGDPDASVAELSTDTSWIGAITFDTPMMATMQDFQNRQTDKQVTILEHKLNRPNTPIFVLGSQFRLSGLVASTNRTSKFPYLGRFPTSFVGDSATDVRILQANLSALAHVTPWVSGYFETLFSDVFSFSSFNQGSYQVRQAYAVIGNASQSPLYAYIGKKNISFGDMGTLSPFTQSVVWHYFGTLAEGAGVGYNANGIDLVLSGINGGRGIRVADSEEIGHLNNFAANLRWNYEVTENFEFTIGGGYLHGTIYDANVAEHLDPTQFGQKNPAWDVNARVRVGNTHLAGEYVQTSDVWPVTNHEVIAYRAEVAHEFCWRECPSWISGSWSEGIQGDEGTEFEFNRQLVIGLSTRPSPNVVLTAEYVRSTGFAPLINITTVSDRSVAQDSLVLGLVFAL